ncbi:MAG: hypothetical protein AB8B65_13230 [Kordia sp.]|uniref:hypothetical protein n=1 Tax=Kordia sp. TaxID=1965332 RepID=UPI00385C318C
MKPTYQIFGSKSSEDFDVCFFVDSLDDTKRNHEAVKMYAEQTVFNTSKPINANLAIVRNGVIVENFKGSADELNNALFTTYGLHDQVYKNHIKKLVSRNLESRIVRCARTLVGNFTRTDLRAQAKAAIRENVNTQLDFLAQIELKKHTDFGKHGSVIEVYKTMAFQLGMTLALLNNKEVYTKEAIIELFPELENYLLRKEQNSEALQKHIKLFITMVKSNIKS